MRFLLDFAKLLIVTFLFKKHEFMDKHVYLKKLFCMFVPNNSADFTKQDEKFTENLTGAGLRIILFTGNSKFLTNIINILL